MIPYEEFLPLLPHEYSYAQYLSYGFDLCMYDPMILNMVSERYPRDEDYASDSDSDSIGDEDFNFGIPPWLFRDLEDEDGPSIQQENDYLKIVFGSCDQDSDLDTIYVAPPIPIIPEIEGLTVKIGEIGCSLAAFKKRNDGGNSFQSEIATLFVDLEFKTTKIATGCVSDCISNCDNCMEDEAKIDFCKSTDPDSEKLLQKQTGCDFSLSDRDNRSKDEAAASTLGKEIAKEEIEQKNSSITMADFIFAATEESTDPDQDHKVFSEIPLISTSINKSASRFSANPFHFPSFYNRSSSTLFAADDFVYAKSIPDLYVLKEVVKEMYLEDQRCEVPYDVKSSLFQICRGFDDLPLSVVGSEEDDAPPWKLLEEDGSLFADLCNLVSSPEPPWELLRHGLQPHDPGDTQVQFRRSCVAFCCVLYAYFVFEKHPSSRCRLDSREKEMCEAFVPFLCVLCHFSQMVRFGRFTSRRFQRFPCNTLGNCGVSWAPFVLGEHCSLAHTTHWMDGISRF